MVAVEPTGADVIATVCSGTVEERSAAAAAALQAGHQRITNGACDRDSKRHHRAVMSCSRPERLEKDWTMRCNLA